LREGREVSTNVGTNKVPVEFRGRARELRRRLGESAEHRDAVDSLVAPIRARLERHPRKDPHPDILTTAARAWRERVPAAGRLTLDVALRRKSLQVHELRAVTGRLRMEDWGADAAHEPGIAVCAIDFTARSHLVKLDTQILATASLHAIARRLQRGRDAADAAVMEEMRALAAAAPGEEDVEVQVPASGGAWVGDRRSVRRHGETVRILCVRTFLD
jgi:hypothetical protein